MNILWLDINTSYSHSSVALPAIHAQVAQNHNWQWQVVRGTINDNPTTLAAEVAKHKPDVIAATFWLFTHKTQIEVLSRAVELLDKVKIFCGGPEFLGDNEQFLRRNTFITAIIRGEGENAFPELLENIDNPSKWNEIKGLCWISGQEGRYYDNGIAKIEDFSKLKYPEESPFFNWEKPFVQLENTRGCFNTCAFCVSGGDKPIRHQSIEQVSARLAAICEKGVKDIRILDRTFNYNSERASRMLDIFAQYDGKMRFHLEIHPALISESLKTKLAAMPKGLLHLEAGIQSLDDEVLIQSGRKGSTEATLRGLKFLLSLENIEVHADLIIGLPSYTFKKLCEDIIQMIDLGVDELQVESLKLLPGTRMRQIAAGRGLKYSPLPPYEILMTDSMSCEEIETGMQISRMLDFYYNTSLWQKVFRDILLENHKFLLHFTNYLKEKMVINSPLSIQRRGLLLYKYAQEYLPERVSDISIAWIEGGLSLKQEPAGEIIKIKYPERFLRENNYKMDIEYGTFAPTHRYYLFTNNNRKVIFGYDSENHHPSPLFRGNLKPR